MTLKGLGMNQLLSSIPLPEQHNLHVVAVVGYCR